MVWIWTIRDENEYFVQFDHRNNEIDSSDITVSLDTNVRVDAPLNFKVMHGSFAGLASANPPISLPVGSGIAMIHNHFIPTMIEIFGEDVQFLAAMLHHKQGTIDCYSVVRPRRSLPCVDLENSVVDWIIEGEAFVAFEHICYHADCLADHHICREIHHTEIVISDFAKVQLARLDDEAMYFVRPEKHISALSM